MDRLHRRRTHRGRLHRRHARRRLRRTSRSNPPPIFGRAELEDLVAGLDPNDIPAGLDVEATIGELDGVIRSAFIRATKPRAIA